MTYIINFLDIAIDGDFNQPNYMELITVTAILVIIVLLIIYIIKKNIKSTPKDNTIHKNPAVTFASSNDNEKEVREENNDDTN